MTDSRPWGGGKVFDFSVFFSGLVYLSFYAFSGGGGVDGTGVGAKIEATVHSSTAKVSIGLGQKIIFSYFQIQFFIPPFHHPPLLHLLCS